ncbi:unnamed protein product, partial [Haemonchus placei]|uniref:Ovule protein n=1 Tax=Haemonchus placei TaxID=6290 RepID=A0A0N4WPC2_HAEPC
SSSTTHIFYHQISNCSVFEDFPKTIATPWIKRFTRYPCFGTSHKHSKLETCPTIKNSNLQVFDDSSLLHKSFVAPNKFEHLSIQLATFIKIGSSKISENVHLQLLGQPIPRKMILNQSC